MGLYTLNQVEVPDYNQPMNWKRDGLTLIFGMLVMLIIFGDQVHVNSPGAPEYIGNLDTVFGTPWWPLMDVIYPSASISTFLLYGKLKGGIKINRTSILLFVVFLIGLVIIQGDDFLQIINHPLDLPDTYWAAARWCYVFISEGSFLAFGSICEKQTDRVKDRLFHF